MRQIRHDLYDKAAITACRCGVFRTVDTDELTLFPHRAAAMAREALAGTRVVVINGAQTANNTSASSSIRALAVTCDSAVDSTKSSRRVRTARPSNSSYAAWHSPGSPSRYSLAGITSYVPDEGFTELSTTDPPHTRNPGSRLWTKVRDDDDSDPGGTMDVHIGRQQWKPGILDPLLRAIAEFECSDVIIMDTDLRCLSHPYDGGADVSLANAQERDQLKASHSDWLSVNPLGR
ncbi:hypothetical protein ABZ815_00455 [Nonomuraea sp. NPDC047529]|uniref:DUF3885 domain-containing protein n=1 Tax=Nonomuraea sp. NPDC047529 TaxID=3155623 RepID=UPI0033FFFB12